MTSLSAEMNSLLNAATSEAEWDVMFDEPFSNPMEAPALQSTSLLLPAAFEQPSTDSLGPPTAAPTLLMPAPPAPAPVTVGPTTSGPETPPAPPTRGRKRTAEEMVKGSNDGKLYIFFML